MEINKDEIKSKALSLVEKVKQDKKVAIGVISGAVLFVLAIVVFLAAGPSKPKTPQDQFRAMLSQTVNNDANLNKILKGFKLDDEKLEIVRDHYKKMFHTTVKRNITGADGISVSVQGMLAQLSKYFCKLGATQNARERDVSRVAYDTRAFFGSQSHLVNTRPPSVKSVKLGTKSHRKQPQKLIVGRAP